MPCCPWPPFNLKKKERSEANSWLEYFLREVTSPRYPCHVACASATAMQGCDSQPAKKDSRGKQRCPSQNVELDVDRQIYEGIISYLAWVGAICKWLLSSWKIMRLFTSSRNSISLLGVSPTSPLCECEDDQVWKGIAHSGLGEMPFCM